MTIAEISHEERQGRFYDSKLLFGRELTDRSATPALSFSTSKPLHILESLLQNKHGKTISNMPVGQTELKKGLQITCKALNLHFKRLRESGLGQVGRGFINVIEESMKTIGYRKEPVIVIVKILPQKRLEVIQKINELPVTEIFTVAGNVDIVLVVEQNRLDPILKALSHINGVTETSKHLDWMSQRRGAAQRER